MSAEESCRQSVEPPQERHECCNGQCLGTGPAKNFGARILLQFASGAGHRTTGLNVYPARFSL